LVTFPTNYLSFFREKIINLFFKAKVDVEFKVLSPNCHKTRIKLIQETKQIIGLDDMSMPYCYYYRLKINSLNNIAPKKLELMITKKLQKNGDEFEEDKSFLPMSLVWSHYRTSVLEHIPPKLFKFCDFGYIIDPNYTQITTQQYITPSQQGEIVLDMDLEVRPYTGSSLLRTGVYRFELVLTGNNIKNLHKTFEINLPKYWSVSEKEMFNNGLSIKEIT